MAAHPEYSNGEVIANKYVVEGFLGESPAARSYLANANMGSQRVCVKLYKPAVSARLLAAPDFFLKAAAMTESEHDNLCACYDVQEEMGMVFVARAFVEGQSFEEWARKHRWEPNYFARGLELLWQASQGLASLHERTRHLAVHPGNVLVSPLVAKLCDWDPRALGNTEMTSEALPLRQEYQGYRAPEASGRAGFLSYPSTDLYAVAALLYRLVKGEHPYPDPGQTLREVVALDKELAFFLGKALHPRPEERFQDAGAFSDSLWELQAAMQRLQQRLAAPPGQAAARSLEAPVAAPESRPRAADPKPVATAEPTVFGSPTGMFGVTEPAASGQSPAGGGDTFFNFHPAAPASQAQPAAPTQPSTGETLFGAGPPGPGFVRSGPGLSSLESSGTFFGGETPRTPEAPRPPDPPRSQSRQPAEPPRGPKPQGVSLSSLEKDPMDLTGAPEMGFTQFGFQGAGEGRTGIFTQERPPSRRKLWLALAGLGALVFALAVGGLLIVTHSGSGSEPLPSEEIDPPAAAAPEPAPAVMETPVAEAPAAAPAEEPPPRPGSQQQGSPGLKAAARTAPQPSSVGDTESGLVDMIQKKKSWPATAGERLKMADDFNDGGKLAEANMAYGKALAASDITGKQKVQAYGGLAVTFQGMGMREQALEAVENILQINPGNKFALGLKEKLK